MFRNRILIGFLGFLIVQPSQGIFGQDKPVESGGNPGIEVLLDQALQFADDGYWEAALKVLNDAEKLAPDEPRIQSYRASIQELYALDEAQLSWTGGNPSEVRSTGQGGDTAGQDGDEPPKFVLDRGEKDPLKNPALRRDNLRADLSLKLLAVNPLTSEAVNTWSTGPEFLYSSLRFDLRYWLPFLGRSIGFNFRSNGYSWVPGEPDILFNTLDLGINLRGFLLESVNSRLELGIDFGASLQTTEETAPGTTREFALYLGLWVSDPLFYHLFRVESLENLVFGGGLRIYATADSQISDTLVYRADGAWNFKSGFAGVRLEWWDFLVSGEQTTEMSVALFGGYRY